MAGKTVFVVTDSTSETLAEHIRQEMAKEVPVIQLPVGARLETVWVQAAPGPALAPEGGPADGG